MSETKTESIEEKKAEHLEKAAKTLTSLYRHMDKIRSARVIRKLEQLIDRIKDLRDTQYLFDSGEYELDRLYDRYLPYLDLVIGNYAEIEETGHDPSEVERVREKLIKAIDTLIDAILTIRDILPQDEISSAKAEAAARKKKEELDRMFPRIDEIKNFG
ncbi:MAG: hypothetical protein Q4C20_03070 [Erysipelotrichaceae bacterium]|nr:hypothetical protein [Erysipelotrichaceae bacterium]